MLLSRNPLGQLSNMVANQWKIMEDIIEVNLVCRLNLLITNLSISIDLVDRIKVYQAEDEKLRKLLTSQKPIQKGDDGIIIVKGRLYAPLNEELRNEVLRETHHSKYTTHRRVKKMY